MNIELYHHIGTTQIWQLDTDTDTIQVFDNVTGHRVNTMAVADMIRQVNCLCATSSAPHGAIVFAARRLFEVGYWPHFFEVPELFIDCEPVELGCP